MTPLEDAHSEVLRREALLSRLEAADTTGAVRAVAKWIASEEAGLIVARRHLADVEAGVA